MATIKVKKPQAADKSLIEVCLPSVVDLPCAGELRQILRENIHSVVIDATEVERISTAAVQVILAAEKELKSKGGNIGFVKVSESMIQAWQDLGLASQLASLRNQEE